MLTLLILALGGGGKLFAETQLLVNCDYNSSTEGTGSVKIDGVIAPIVDGAICVPVSDFAALKAAVEAGKNVQLTADITTTSAIKTEGITSVIDLNDKTLTIGAGDNKFNDESNITIKNGNVNITGVTVKGNAIFCLDEYEKTLVSTLTFDNVNLTGDGYSSDYGIFYIGESSVLNVNGGKWNLNNDTHASGGVFKADGSGAKLNIDGLNLTAHNVRRVVTYANTTIENSTMAISGDADGVDAEMEHGFNRSPLAISNSTITMKYMVGRGITAQNGAVIISENSNVNITNCQEATIDVRNNQTVTIENSTVFVDKKPTIANGCKINGDVILSPMGNDFNGYTRTDAIWGEVWGNARESFVINVLDAEGIVMGTTSLNNIGGIINGNVNVTWSLKFDAASNTDEYWTMSWTKTPTINNMPAKVELLVDGVKVSGGPVVLNGPDNINAVDAAIIDENGVIKSYTTFAKAKTGDNIAIVKAGTYTVPSGKNLTITGAVEGVVFANIGAHNMGGANVTFNNVTFNYANVNYRGLQHAGDLAYNNCTFNGQLFLYGESETFNKCTFNQNSSDAYNVWTYSAKEVEFNECTFNSAGKSVLIYAESAEIFNNVTVAKCTFNASQAVEGKAAIEMDSSLTDGINLTIDAETTASGFGKGNVSNNSLWNNKKGNADAANNDITVTVDNTDVLKPIILALEGEGTAENPYLINNLEELVWFRDNVDKTSQDGSTQYAGKYIKLTADIDLAGINWNPIGSMSSDHGSFKGVFDGDNHIIKNLNVEQAGNGIGLFARTTGNAVIKNLKLNNVTVKSTDNSSYVGGVVGNAYASTKIENVHISGDVQISGRGYIGGIAGHGYVVMDKVSVVAKERSFITSTFWCAGGILGYAGEGSTNIMNANVEGITITSAAGGLGAIVGMAEDNNGTQPISGSNLSAKNVDIKTYVDAYGTSYANYALGYLYGGNETSILTGELSVENVNVITSTGEEAKVVDAVANVDGKIYFNLASAIATIGNGDVTINLLRDVTLDYNARDEYGIEGTTSVTINGNNHTLTLNQKNSDWASIGLLNGKLVLNNMTIEKTGYGDTSGAWNTHAIIFSCPLEMTNVTVNNGIAVQAGATLDNVTINEAGEYYGLWINGNGQTVTMNGGAINAPNAGRGIKIADQYIDTPAQVKLNVAGTKFTTAKKAAVLVSSEAGAKITAEDVDITNVAADKVNFVWVDEDWAANFGKVEVTGAKVAQEGIEKFVAAVKKDAKVEGYYASLQAAINAVQNGGTTLELLEDATIANPINVTHNLTIVGNGKTVTSTAARAFNIETTGKVVVNNLTVNAGERAFNIINEAATVELNGVTATASNNAVMIATSAGAVTLTINNSDLTGLAVVNVAGAGSKVAINNTEITNVDANPKENYGAITIWTSAENAKVVVSDGKIIVADDSRQGYVFPATATIEGVENVGYIIVTVGDAGYETLAEAIEDVKANGTISFIRNGKGAGVVINKDITIDFNGKTYTFSELGVGSGTLTSNGFQILKGNNVTLKNGTLNVAEAMKAKYYILVQNYANLNVENMNLDGTNLDKWSKTDGDSYVLSNNSGNVNIVKTTITANNDGDKAFAFDVCKKASYEAPVVTLDAKSKIYGRVELSGGQFYPEKGVTVSLTKSVEAYQVAEGGNQLESGWYTIGVPFTVTPSLTEGYELFRYNEAEAMWENHKNQEHNTFGLQVGRGYLYAHANGADLNLEGEANIKDYSTDLSYTTDATHELKGFHLVGNPYTFSISGNHFSGNVADGFYTLANSGAWVVKQTADEIAVGEGFLVQAKSATKFAINKKATKTRSADNGSLQINVANAKYSDVAYVSFNEGVGLNKISHQNTNIPMVYVPVEGENYSIAYMNANVEEIPFAFEAKTMGSYTISVEAQNCEFSTMTLIDRFTGIETNLLFEDYSFVAKSSDNSNRFIIRLSQGTTDLEEEHFAYINNNGLIINNASSNATLQIFDVMGRPVSSHNLSGNANIAVESLTNGVYILRLIDDNNVRIQKVVID